MLSSDTEHSPADDVIAVLPPPGDKLDEKPRQGSTKPKREPLYHVIIWNDETHSYEYVIELLMKIFSHPYTKAYDITQAVDKAGKGIAFTTHQELAELKRDQILAYGPDWRMKISEGSIRATIEPVPE